MPTFASQRGISLLMWGRTGRNWLGSYCGSVLESSYVSVLEKGSTTIYCCHSFHFFADCIYCTFVFSVNLSLPLVILVAPGFTPTQPPLPDKSAPPSSLRASFPFLSFVHPWPPAVPIFLQQRLWITVCDKLPISWNYLGLCRLSGLTSLGVGFEKPNFSLLRQKILHPDSFD